MWKLPGIFSLIICVLNSPLQAGFLGAEVTFSEVGSENDGDLFTIKNISDPGNLISRITINLAPGLIFDVANNGFGQNPYQGYSPVAGFTGTAALSATLVDGATSLAIDFTSFAKDAVFQFRVDVDEPAGPNGADRMNIALDEFAGTSISAVFSGAFENSPLTVTDSFTSASSNLRLTAEVEDNLPADIQNVAAFANPEPAGVVLFSVGALGLMHRFRRRKIA